MKKDNTKVKRSLIIQSFAPLFLILTIKHFNICEYYTLVRKFLISVSQSGAGAIKQAIIHPLFGEFVVFLIGICWLFITVSIAFGFKAMQNAGFKSAGEQIIIDDKNNDSSATFLVTYVLPLLTDNLGNLRELIAFLVLLTMVLILMINSKTFYQNPVLAALKYRTFSFKFVNPDSDIEDDEKVYIGITRGTPITEKAVIKRKYISDGVFLVYND